MTHDELVAYCLAKPGAVEDEPWEDDLRDGIDPGQALGPARLDSVRIDRTIPDEELRELVDESYDAIVAKAAAMAAPVDPAGCTHGDPPPDHRGRA